MKNEYQMHVYIEEGHITKEDVKQIIAAKGDIYDFPCKITISARTGDVYSFYAERSNVSNKVIVLPWSCVVGSKSEDQGYVS